MKSLFSKEGLKILESFCFAPTLFAFDYDGTLSKIVRNPSEARLSKQTAELLRRLEKLAPVGVISGRAVKDLTPLLSYRPKYLIGNHGLEGLRASKGSLENAKKVCVRWKEEFSVKIRRHSGVSLEDKDFSLALHYRRSRSKAEVRASLLESCGELTPSPRIILGKCVINLVPPGAPHKGMALLELMLECGARNAFYLGDDDTDEDVFALPDARLLSVRVGQKRNSSAHYYLERQGDLNRQLRRIIGFLERE